MTIRSKPYSPEGRDNWDRIFRACGHIEKGWACALKKGHDGEHIYELPTEGELIIPTKEKPQ